jgi:hypothetical protein
MVSTRISFAFMKRLARRKVALLKRAVPSAEVSKMVDRLNRSIDLLDDCGGMGFRVTFRSTRAMSPRRKAVKRTKRA